MNIDDLLPISGKKTVFVKSGYMSVFNTYSPSSNSLKVLKNITVILYVENQSSKEYLIHQLNGDNFNYDKENPIFVVVSETEGVLSIDQSGFINNGVDECCWHRMVFKRLSADVDGVIHLITNFKLNSSNSTKDSKHCISLANIYAVEKDSNFNLSIDYVNTNRDFSCLPFTLDLFIVAEEDLIYINARIKIPVSNNTYQ